MKSHFARLSHTRTRQISFFGERFNLNSPRDGSASRNFHTLAHAHSLFSAFGRALFLYNNTEMSLGFLPPPPHHIK
jgi:hypothetical protein